MADPIPEEVSAPVPEAAPRTGPTWFQRLTTILFIIFYLELGLFLLVYPWTDGWNSNYFGWFAPGAMQEPWHEFWRNAYVRGALSGLGLVNLSVALSELFKLFSRNGPVERSNSEPGDHTT